MVASGRLHHVRSGPRTRGRDVDLVAPRRHVLGQAVAEDCGTVDIGRVRISNDEDSKRGSGGR